MDTDTGFGSDASNTWICIKLRMEEMLVEDSDCNISNSSLHRAFPFPKCFMDLAEKHE